MTNIFGTQHGKADNRSYMPKAPAAMRLVRHFIETGDERCPLAGMWTELMLTEPLDSEPEIRRPVREFFHLGRAFTCA